MDRAEQFAQAYRNMNLFPLYSETEIKEFRVPYGQRTLAKLQNALEASGETGKIIFTGHRGCGKSTLLGQLAEKMRTAGLFVSGFSIADMVEMSDVNHINILYSIALRLLDKADKLNVNIPKGYRDDLVNWFTQTKSRTYSDQLKQEMSVGVDFLKFFTGKLQKEGSFREEIKETYERRVSDLSVQIDRVAAAIEGATGKKVLVIIDDLDKLDLGVAKTVFQENIKALFSPNIRVVFTIPVAVVRETRLRTTLDSEGTTIMLSVTKFFSQAEAHKLEGKPLEKNVEIFEKILEKRIKAELIEPEIKRKIVLMSGGVLRELVRIGQECCRECMLELSMDPERTDITIDEAIFTEAIQSLRNQFARTLGTNLYELLVETYQTFTPPDATSDEFLELLHGLYVLEYENADLWYDLHPMVTDLLQRKRLLEG
ncbi:MAG: ATP-binding protein [Cyanobacteria bacterium P01_F01_bin.53]